MSTTLVGCHVIILLGGWAQQPLQLCWVRNFQFSILPAADAIVIDSVVAICHKFDKHNCLSKRKVRVCGNSLQQIAGIHFDKSFAPAILAASLNDPCGCQLAQSVPVAHRRIKCFQVHSGYQSINRYEMFSRLPPAVVGILAPSSSCCPLATSSRSKTVADQH